MKYTLLLLALAGSLYAADPVILFDGTSLDAFTDAKGAAPAPGWVIEDGALHRKEKAGDIITKKEFSNFELEWEWKVAPGANSGLKYWVNQFPKGGWLGIEFQMIDDGKHPDAVRGNTHSTACFYDIKPAAADKTVKPAGEWNSSKIIAKGGKVQHFLNGKLACEADTKSEEWKAAIANSKFKAVEGFAPGKGHILLQDHGDEAWFRNMRIIELP